MGMSGTSVQWNSAPYAASSLTNETKVAWNYYSHVSMSSPTAQLTGYIEADLYPVKATSVRTAEGPIARSTSREAKQWGPWSLTQRELEVLQLLAEGTTNSEISDRLFISPKTTKNHLAAIFQKLDVTNRTQALVRAVVMGLVSIE
jgi:DNA-binding NarL/FixJ family response regulator